VLDDRVCYHAKRTKLPGSIQPSCVSLWKHISQISGQPFSAQSRSNKINVNDSDFIRQGISYTRQACIHTSILTNGSQHISNPSKSHLQISRTSLVSHSHHFHTRLTHPRVRSRRLHITQGHVRYQALDPPHNSPIAAWRRNIKLLLRVHVELRMRSIGQQTSDSEAVA
jgi:hypothetical protein